MPFNIFAEKVVHKLADPVSFSVQIGIDRAVVIRIKRTLPAFMMCSLITYRCRFPSLSPRRPRRFLFLDLFSLNSSKLQMQLPFIMGSKRIFLQKGIKEYHPYTKREGL